MEGRSAWAWRVGEALAWTALFACLRALFGLFETGVLDPSPNFNGDTLFIADVVRDLRSGGRLSDWNIPHALFVLPDVLIWAVALCFTASVQQTMVFFGVLQICIGALLFRILLVRQYGRGAALVGVAAFCLVLAFLARGEIREALNLVRPMHHFGVALTGFGAMLCMSWWFARPKADRLAVLALIIFLACLSDPFSLTCVAAPIAAVPVLVALRTSVGRLQNLLATALLTGAAVAGNLFARAFTSVGSDLGQLQPQRLGEQWGTLRLALSTLQWSAPDILCGLALVLAPLLFLRGVKQLRTPGLGPVLDVVPLMAVVANEAALMVTGNMVPVLLNRYQVVIFAYLMLTLARTAALLARWPRLLTMSAVLISGTSAYFMWSQISGKPSHPITQWAMPGTDCVVREAQARGAQRGLADIIVARPLTMLNSAGIRFDPMENALPRWWLATRRPYADLEPPVAFFVLSYLNHPSLVQERFGTPAEVVNCPPMQLWFWAPEQRAEVTRRLAALPVRTKEGH